MISTIRRRLRLSPAGVVAVMALVFAMIGGAYAASGALTGKQKKEVKAIAKSFQGKGPTGAQGPAGAAGKDGANGINGKDGTQGIQGEPGQNGSPGKNVTLTAEPEGANCGVGTGGGVKVEVEGTPASKKYVCNGSPWTAGGTLPKGKTETGVWTVAIPSSGFMTVTNSFNIPLSAKPQVVFVPAGKEEEFETECPGSVKAPAASEGFACFYEEPPGTAVPVGQLEFPQGVLLIFVGSEGEEAYGTWAVTAS